MKDEFDIPTGNICRDYEMLTSETFLEFYDNDECGLCGKLCDEEDLEEKE